MAISGVLSLRSLEVAVDYILSFNQRCYQSHETVYVFFSRKFVRINHSPNRFSIVYNILFFLGFVVQMAGTSYKNRIDISFHLEVICMRRTILGLDSII